MSLKVSNKDGISIWYKILIVFLTINLCGLGYLYYYKFYGQQKQAETTQEVDSLLTTIDVPVPDMTESEPDAVVESPAKVVKTPAVKEEIKTVVPSKSEKLSEEKTVNNPVSPTKMEIKDGITGTWLVCLGTFRELGNAEKLVQGLIKQGIPAEAIAGDMFEKMQKGYTLVIVGKRLSEKQAQDLANEMKLMGQNYYVRDGGAYGAN